MRYNNVSNVHEAKKSINTEKWMWNNKKYLSGKMEELSSYPDETFKKKRKGLRLTKGSMKLKIPMHILRIDQILVIYKNGNQEK
jgi:hypothetical protein